MAQCYAVLKLKDILFWRPTAEIGRVHDFYLDDAQEWVIRYLVVDTGYGWWAGALLISPTALHQPDWEQKGCRYR